MFLDARLASFLLLSSVLSNFAFFCLIQYVDDVLIDAPYVITQEMISSLGIHVVVRSCPTGKTVSEPAQDEEDPYFLARAQDMLTTVYTSHDITAMDFVDRIQNQRERYQARYAKKMEAELDFYKNKYSL